jgi:MinD-like ATPase involved in chromosome partitioning or flagellar assembly
MLITLMSAKGAPGVTTAALALVAAASPAQGLAVEMDPSGGDVECLLGGTGTSPGLLEVAVDLRRDIHPDALLARAVEAPKGVRVVIGPTTETQSSSALAAAGARLPAMLASLDAVVVADAGRWSRSQPTALRVQGSTVAAVVLQPTVAGVEHSRELVQQLRGLGIGAIAAVTVGDRPYPAIEVAAALGVPVAGTIAFDPGGVHALLTGGASRQWRRSWLARSSAETLAGLTHIATGVTV